MHRMLLYFSTLPAKSVAEQRRHEAQYLALIETTKRQEAKRARQRQQLLDMKRKEEDETAAAAEVWCNRILPLWENMYAFLTTLSHVRLDIVKIFHSRLWFTDKSNLYFLVIQEWFSSRNFTFR